MQRNYITVVHRIDFRNVNFRQKRNLKTHIKYTYDEIFLLKLYWCTQRPPPPSSLEYYINHLIQNYDGRYLKVCY